MDRLSQLVREVGPTGLAGIAAFALLLTVADTPATTWDEGATIRREGLVRAWFERLAAAPGIFPAPLLSESILAEHWPFAREEPDGHPPFYALIGLAGWFLSCGWLAPLQAYRFGPLLLSSVTVAVMFRFVDRRFGRLAAVAAAGTWLLMPRVFVHARLASYDAPLACLWFLCVVAFWKTIERVSHEGRPGACWPAAFAGLLGLAAATKFTGWLIPLPLAAWSLVVAARSARGMEATAVRGLVALVCFGLPWLAAVPQVVGIVEQLGVLERSVVDGELDSQQRAARAASVVRARVSGSVPFWAVLVPPLFWAVVQLWRRGRARVLLGDRPILHNWIAAAALTPSLTILLIPNWWHDPVRGLGIFLWSNLTRQKTTWIPTQFFHDLYAFSLPWYNTLAWVALTVPAISLLLIVLGLLATMRGAVSGLGAAEIGGGSGDARALGPARGPGPDDRRPLVRATRAALAWLLGLNAATLLVIRALPNAPGHDGERQLLGSFPFLAVFAGIGAAAIQALLARHFRLALSQWIARAVVLSALALSGTAIWHYRSAPLSYYTELVGGLRGASRLGLEPTYYWDALDRRAIEWLNDRTRPGETVVFCNDFLGLRYLQRWGTLRAAQWPIQPGTPRWYVLQNRPGLFAEKPWDRWLAERGRAEYVHAIDGVPLLWIFPYTEYARATQETRSDPAGS